MEAESNLESFLRETESQYTQSGFEFFAEYEKQITTIVRRMLRHSGMFDDAASTVSDVAIPAIILAHKDFSVYHGCTLKTYCYNHVRWAMLKYIAKTKKRRAKLSTFAEVPDVAEKRDEAENVLEYQKEAIASCLDLLEKLPRQLIVLRYIKGWSAIEIADQFGKSESWVNKKICSAIELIRANYKKG